jgi:type I restriction enzyme S subunit
MKNDWQIKKLGEVCDMYQPQTISTKEMSENGLYPVFGANGIIGKYDKYNHEEPQLLITCRGATCGSINISEQKSWINGNAMVIKPKDDTIDLKFLQYLFLGGIDFSRVITGSAQPQITRQSLNPVEISYPPLSEQKAIVAVLDEAFGEIEKVKANTEQNLKNAKELFQSYLQGVFENKGDDWEEKKLGEVCETGAGGTPLKTHKDYYEGGTIPWLLSGEVSQGEIFDAKHYITEKGLKNSSAKMFPKDTVLIAMYGATAGQVGILRFESSTNQAICGILPNKNFLPEFLYYKFLAGKDLLVSQAVGGAQPNISQIKIKNTLIPIMPLTEQQTIVHQLDALRAETQRLESIYRDKLLNLEELKKSILQKAFSGELRG